MPSDCSGPSAKPVVRWDEPPHSLLLRPETGAWVVTDGVGADIVELCDGRRSGRAIAGHIAAAYAADLHQVQDDVSRYLASLDATGFLRTAPPPPPTYRDGVLSGIAVHVTSRCQLTCRHCYASPGPIDHPDPPLALLVSAVHQARELGATAVKITGGDPLARPEALDALVGPVGDATVTLFTNGMAALDTLLAHVVERGWQLQISLDGADAATHDWYRGAGAHARLAANLRGLVAHGAGSAVTLSVCLSRRNADQVEAIVRQAIEWGLAGVHVTRISRHGRAADFWDQFSLSEQEWVAVYRELSGIEARYRDHLRLTGFVLDYVRSCLAHRWARGCILGRQVMMDLDGHVYPCIMVTTPQARLGNLHAETLADCIAPERLAGSRETCASRLTNADVCGSCDWRMICRGACPGWPIVQDGTPLATDGLCELRRELFPKAIFEMAGAAQRNVAAVADPPWSNESPCPE